MRIFVPTTVEELFLAVPPSRRGVIPRISGNLTADEIELAYEEAIDEAAFRSLSLAIEYSGIPRRVVLAGEAVVASDDDTDAVSGWTSWKQIQSLHIDSSESGKLVVEVSTVDNQELLDQKVGDLFEQSLEWFDISELDDLRSLYAKTIQSEGTDG